MDKTENQLKKFFEHIDDVKKILSNKELIIFLDYDGTLTPIVDTPDLALCSDETRQTISKLSSLYRVAIVSGRATDDVRGKVSVEGIFYAGSHGFEIVDPQMNVKINDEAQAIRPVIDEAHARLGERLNHIKGALVENVKYTISAHYRLVADGDFSEFKKIVEDTVSEYQQLRMTSGKKVFELRPKIDWHKGKAVHWILEVLNFDKNKSVAMYIGDDTTDEDAFEELKDKGFGVLCASEPRATKATYIVNSTDEVQRVLELLIELKS